MIQADLQLRFRRLLGSSWMVFVPAICHGVLRGAAVAVAPLQVRSDAAVRGEAVALRLPTSAVTVAASNVARREVIGHSASKSGKENLRHLERALVGIFFLSFGAK